MAFTAKNTKQLSDLVVNDQFSGTGLSRETINVTPPNSSGTLRMGQVVFRTKASGAADAAPYAILASNANVAIANEFAVVFGDEFGFNEEFIPNATSSNMIAGNAVAFIRGPISLKEYYIKAIAQEAGGANLTDVQFDNLKGLLANQGIVVELTLANQ